MKKKDRRNDSPIKNLIRESVAELHGNAFPDDPTLDAEELTGPERFEKTQKRKDEVVIDTLLSDISSKDGYFIKIKKELRPNEWMMMKTIEHDWRQWADIETAVCDIVKEHTKKSPQKWGTGAYRVEIACKSGLRGKGYNPIDVYVNAEEEFLNLPNNGTVQPQVDPTAQVTGQLDMLAQLMNVVRGVVPTPQNPAEIQSQIASAFQQGMQMKMGESSNSTQLMIAMMTTMMGVMKETLNTRPNNEARIVNPEDTLSKMLGVMKDMGVIGQNSNTAKEKSVIDFAKELQTLGIDLFKKEEPLEQINKLKQLASIAGQFMGMGGENADRPSILEKIIDVVGPSIPGIIKDIKETANNAVKVQEIAGQNIEKAKQLEMKKPTTQPNMEQSQQANANVQVNPQVEAFFNQLYESVKMNNRMFYPIIYTSLLQDQNGQQLIQGIANGTQNAQHVIDLLQQHGGDRFKESEFVMKYLVSYVNGFIIWIQQLVSPVNQTMSPTKTFEVECPTCRVVYEYATEQEFNNEQDKACGNNGCKGLLQPSVKAVV